MRAAVIGFGGIGKVHTAVLAKLGIELAAVCDTDESKLAGLPCRTYTDWRTMLVSEMPDVVHICTPHYLHCEQAVGALAAGINVLCEKPLCIREDEISEITEAAANSRAVLGVVHQNRYNPANLFAKELIRGRKALGGTGLMPWRRDEKYYAADEWRGKRETEGGGVLINQALHTLDLMQWFVGFPEYVSANVCNLSLGGKIEVEDTACLVCSGTAGFNFFATNASAADYGAEITLETDGGRIKILPDCVLEGGKAHEFASGAYCGKICYGSGHEALVRDFYDCIASGRKFAIDAEEGAKVVRIILAAYRSHGERVKI